MSPLTYRHTDLMSVVTFRCLSDDQLKKLISISNIFIQLALIIIMPGTRLINAFLITAWKKYISLPSTLIVIFPSANQLPEHTPYVSDYRIQ